VDLYIHSPIRLHGVLLNGQLWFYLFRTCLHYVTVPQCKMTNKSVITFVEDRVMSFNVYVCFNYQFLRLGVLP
jgi:hypothetical protein